MTSTDARQSDLWTLRFLSLLIPAFLLAAGWGAWTRSPRAWRLALSRVFHADDAPRLVHRRMPACRRPAKTPCRPGRKTRAPDIRCIIRQGAIRPIRVPRVSDKSCRVPSGNDAPPPARKTDAGTPSDPSRTPPSPGTVAAITESSC
jgi:hypothetical protein